MIKAIATGTPPDLVTLNNPVVASFSAQDSSSTSPTASRIQGHRPGPLLQGSAGIGRVEGAALQHPARREHARALLQRRPVPRQGPRSGQAAADLVGTAGRRREAARSGEERLRLRLLRHAVRARRVPVAARSSGRPAARSTSSTSRKPPRRCSTGPTWCSKDIASKDVINQSSTRSPTPSWPATTAMAMGGPWELPRIGEEREVRMARRRRCR